MCHDRPSSETDAFSTNNPTDVPYARVNKPPRAATQAPEAPADSSASGPQGAMALSAPTSPQAAAEQKYWHLEPEHTYEETPGTARREEIDFYAVGRRRQPQQNEGEERGTERGEERGEREERGSEAHGRE